MTFSRRWLGRSLLALALATAYSVSSFGVTLDELQTSGHLRIDSAITPSKGIVPGQRITLTLYIATDTWFTGGTRIGIPEVPGLVILQTEQFASNASETHNGQSWVVQRWTLDIFAQRAGEFTIEPLPLQIQVNAGASGNVKGELHSPPQQFSVAIPQSLAGAQHWVAAPQFSVSQQFDRPLAGLKVGDAFEQEVRFEASDVQAMMLPVYNVEKQSGLAAYPSPPTLDNSNNRGERLASRSVRISYVVEQPGQYVIPAKDYFWWNTRRAELILLSLPETRIDVAGFASTQQAPQATFSFSPRQWLVLAVGIALLLAAARMAWLVLPRVKLAHGEGLLGKQLRRLQGLFKPALATRLNPGSSAEE